MKALGDTLQAMKFPADGEREQRHGLMTTDGQSIIQLRQQPLTERQLTEIASLVLRQPFTIVCEEKKVYGTKKFRDEFGDGYSENQVLGTEMVTDCVVDINPSLPVAMLQSALMASPHSAYLKHITHLAMHKKFGSTDQDRTIMLADYVKAIRDFPEFVVYQVCRFYWENDRRPFVPFIGEITDACKSLTECLKNHLQRMQEPSQPKIQKQEVKQEDWTLPTEEEKAKAKALVDEAIRYLSAG